MNLAQAEEAFLAAGRYARTDYPQDAGQAFLSAGWAAYCQGKMNEALNHTEQAINASSILVEALFQASKILMAINRPQNALPYLGKAIETDRFFALKAAGDGDFQKHESELRNFLETMRKEKYKQISKTLPEMIKKIEHVRYPSNVIELKTRMERALREGKTWPLMDVLSIEQEWRSIILNRCVLLWIKKKSEILPNQVPETVYVTETYQEQVLVRPGGFFRKPQYREETRTRQVQKVKMVNKTISLELHIIGHVDEPQATMEFVRIPAGEFIMGEGGGHSVILTQDFWMGRYPVTQAYWKAVMGNTPGHFKGDNHPVDSVSWDDVQDFIKVLNKMIGESRYCLPTEAQWEYACRAGTTTAYYTGDSEEDLTRAGWYEKNSGSQTHPVGEKEPNAWGLYDMHGNVFEWCNDWYGAYPSGTVTDPAGPVSGSLRVIRGGAWDFDAGYCRSASRYWRDPADRGGYLGFRLVLLPGR
jgi:formylglycine-generating enzyme required for sulfatase activity